MSLCFKLWGMLLNWLLVPIFLPSHPYLVIFMFLGISNSTCYLEGGFGEQVKKPTPIAIVPPEINKAGSIFSLLPSPFTITRMFGTILCLWTRFTLDAVQILSEFAVDSALHQNHNPFM